MTSPQVLSFWGRGICISLWGVSRTTHILVSPHISFWGCWVLALSLGGPKPILFCLCTKFCNFTNSQSATICRSTVACRHKNLDCVASTDTAPYSLTTTLWEHTDNQDACDKNRKSEEAIHRWTILRQSIDCCKKYSVWKVNVEYILLVFECLFSCYCVNLQSSIFEILLGIIRDQSW